jgi:hypothetical protein
MPMDVFQIVYEAILLLGDVMDTLCRENWWFLFLSAILVFSSIYFSICEMYEQYVTEVQLVYAKLDIHLPLPLNSLCHIANPNKSSCNKSLPY